METSVITSTTAAHGEGSRRHFYLYINSSPRPSSARKATHRGTILTAASYSSSPPGNLIMLFL